MTRLDPINEDLFLKDYGDYAQKMGINPDPDDPRHFYDYRGKWLQGGLVPNSGGHLSSQFKLVGHPRTILNGTNTVTGEKNDLLGYINYLVGRNQ